MIQSLYYECIYIPKNKINPPKSADITDIEFGDASTKPAISMENFLIKKIKVLLL